MRDALKGVLDIARVSGGLLLRQFGEEGLAGGVGVCTVLERCEIARNCFESRPTTINNCNYDATQTIETIYCGCWVQTCSTT